MNRAELQERQAPLKERYRGDPDAARLTLSASASLGEGISCSVETGRAIAEAGLHPATGGDGTQLCSGDMLLEALAACAGVTLRSVATSLEIPVEGGTVKADGVLDFRGTLAVDREAAVGFSSISLAFELDTDADEEQLDTLIKLTERYCVVLQTLSASPELSVTRSRQRPRVYAPTARIESNGGFDDRDGTDGEEEADRRTGVALGVAVIAGPSSSQGAP